MRPSIFIASSVEGLNVAYAIQQNLNHEAEITVWSQGVFDPSNYALEDLIEMLGRVDFSIFVFSADDVTVLRGNEQKTVRDNVLFEMGLFMGRLGRNRVFGFKPNDAEIHIASDLLGLNILSYENNRSDKNLAAGTGSACNEVRNKMKKEGVLHENTEVAPTANEPNSTDKLQDSFEEEFIRFHKNKNFQKCFDILNEKIGESKIDKENIAYICVRAVMLFRINTEKGEAEFRKLIEETDENIKYEALAYTIRGLNIEEYFFKSLSLLNMYGVHTDKLIIQKTECLLGIGKWQEAKDYLKKEIEQKDSTKLKLKYFDILGESYSNDIEDRHSIIRELFLENPGDEEVLQKYAQFSSDILKNNHISLFLWTKLSDMYPKDHKYLAKIGDITYDLKLYNVALNSYEKANEVSERKESWILSNTGNLLNSRGLYSLARNYFKDSLGINPNSSYTLQRLSDIASNEKMEIEEKNKCLKQGQTEVYSVLSI
ncbi:Predicted nucleotide-binding protein containing TIR-like domain-containing protein [Paenibacillus sp. OK060]|uniref:TIR domain-containing protein n=1 Tax=Paenibacillus sp. OK060 TaxID=1881034 RepID=UPI000890BF69|nr:TIR domain-containing protein [Paenibacillus sp. OK060]SDL33389.1 Predicted nucleotide-binding protein containing TIR-like domain-containing protein [Paenibacillus sp. OK060]